MLSENELNILILKERGTIMKKSKRIIIFLLLILSFTLSSIGFTPTSQNVITVSAANMKPSQVKKVTKIKATDTSLKIKYSKVKKAKGYQIRVYKVKHLVKKINTSKTYVTIKSLEPNTTYKIKVRAYIKSGKKLVYGKEKTISYSTKSSPKSSTSDETSETTTETESTPETPVTETSSETNNSNNNTTTTNTENPSSNSSVTNVTYVYLSKTGTKYHKIPYCGTMRASTARMITLEEAISKGYSRCSKCF